MTSVEFAALLCLISSILNLPTSTKGNEEEGGKILRHILDRMEKGEVQKCNLQIISDLQSKDNENLASKMAVTSSAQRM